MTSNVRIAQASEMERHTIYALRHEVYARELHQHPENAEHSLSDSLDASNVYIVASIGNAIAGFVSITPPDSGSYSLDKYLRRDEIPFPLDDATYEVRILTVVPAYRGTIVPMLLMYAALRWVESRGGTRIVGIGRREVRGLYAKGGLRSFGREFRSGSVAFRLMSEQVSVIREHVPKLGGVFARMEEAALWELGIPFHKRSVSTAAPSSPRSATSSTASTAARR